MSDDIDRRVTSLEEAYGEVARDLSRHLGGCERWSETVTATLVRFEKAIDGINRDLNRRAWAVIGAQGLISLAVFGAWLAVQHNTH